MAAAAALAATAALAPAAQAARPRAQVLDPARLGTTPVAIHDGLRPGAGHRLAVARASQALYGGRITASDGEQVTVYLSPGYPPDPAVLQSWADMLTGLPHGDELGRLTVLIAPFDEMQQYCSADAESCYEPAKQLMVVVGDTSGITDGATLEDLVAHEYGHHIAANRNNSPWEANDTGPKYWATALHVCQATDSGDMYPGNEGAHYTLNPGEGWAETYRALAEGGHVADWPIVDPIFYPTAATLAAARRDVEAPFQGDQYVVRRGRFGPHSHRHWDDFVVPVQNDGRIHVRLRSTGSLDADVYVFAHPTSKHWLQRSTRTGHRERLSGTYCGYRHLDIAVYRYSGSGRFRAEIDLPYSADG